MSVAFLIENIMTFMILLAILSMMYVNRDVKIPATNLFIGSVITMLLIIVCEALSQYVDVSLMSPEQAAATVRTHLIASTFGYILRPCLILSELLIVLRSNKYRLLCIIPAGINAVIFSTALFGSKIAFYIDGNNRWHGGPVRLIVYITQIIYLLLLLIASFHSFYNDDRRKSLILIVMFLQALFAAFLEYNNISDYTNPITVLCILEYYIFLSTVYRQELAKRLDLYVDKIEEAGISQKNLTEEVMEALAGAIDAKDTYTNGHSRRVAEYSRIIAKSAGKSDEDCEQIYFAALLHDVGKIGVPIEILTKKGRLTDEEFNEIKQHPIVGGQILSTISEYPWLSIGARFHHERYNGTGYPEGLAGEQIPDIARIIAVADAYDAMTSNRSYRDAIPQHIVREELVKGIGTQFDPDYARSMIHILDLDTEYKMKEIISGTKVSSSQGLRCNSIYHECTEGIGLTHAKTTVSFFSEPDRNFPMLENCLPTLIVFDSLDGNVHPGEEDNKDLLYFEYAQIRIDGKVTDKNVRACEVRPLDDSHRLRKHPGDPEYGQIYQIEAVRNRDHALIRVSTEQKAFDVILALPDTARYISLSISGENCEVHNIHVNADQEKAPADAIPRIAEEISYTRGCPTGDIPNIEIDGPRVASSEGIPIKDGFTISFHTISYPTARLVWHCPYFSIFYSDNGQVDGDNFREYLLLKMDGENWESEERVVNRVRVDKTDTFKSWNDWMVDNKLGLDCTLKISRKNGQIIMETENLGISLFSVTTIQDGTEDVYFALTGDQCALSNIKISR